MFHYIPSLHEDVFEHEHLTEADRERISQFIFHHDTVELRTVGIDIGSSTSHLIVARIVMQRETDRLSSRFRVIERRTVWESPIALTPFVDEETIDAAALDRLVAAAYEAAGIARDDVDSGAVILTGEAIKRKNARAIDHLFAHEAGRFVCATAGHKLEATLAAHGSGAMRISRERDACVLHVDVGGGTTKLALIDRGSILGVGAFAGGGRVIAADADGAWTRVDEAARLAAQDLGLATDPATLADPRVREAIAERLAAVAMDYITDAPLDALGARLALTERIPRGYKPSAITFSGGVSEYLFGRERADFGDIGPALATALRRGLAARAGAVAVDPGIGIRATVIGASQFTVQVSGKTIYLPAEGVLPLRNVPVVHIALGEPLSIEGVSDAVRAALARSDLGPESCMAIAFSWRGDPEYTRLLTVARGIVRAVGRERRHAPLVLMIDGDVAKSLGHLIDHELGLCESLVAIDGVQLQELDYVDVGELMQPAGVVPVVIKSLLFA